MRRFIVWIEPHKEGPGKALETALPMLDPHTPILVSYCDYGMMFDAHAFEHMTSSTGCDAAVLGYSGYHPQYRRAISFARCRIEKGRIREIREKGQITLDPMNEFTSSGCYYFRDIEILRRALHVQRQRNLLLKGELYTSLTVEALLQDNPTACVMPFTIDSFDQWGTPEDVADFRFAQQSFHAIGEPHGLSDASVDQILMPMAGLGARFKPEYEVPKPLIPVANQPMFLRALHSLPKASRTVFVVLASVHEAIKPVAKKVNATCHILPETPPEQAFSAASALEHLNPNQDILISACDHEVAVNKRQWDRLRADPHIDGAVFTIQGFPGARSNPTSYSYAVFSGDDAFLEISRVSVKSPTTPHPEREHLAVGTFWFRRAALFKKGIQEVIDHGTRHNGELYLDNIVEPLVRDGARIVTVPLKGYLCMGTPEELAAYQYWYKRFQEPSTHIHAACA